MSINSILNKINQKWCTYAAKVRGLLFEILAQRSQKQQFAGALS